MQEDRAALVLAIELDLAQQQTAVLGEHDRAGVRKEELSRGARERSDVISFDEAGPDPGWGPLRLPLAQDLDTPDDARQLGADRLGGRLLGIRRMRQSGNG